MRCSYASVLDGIAESVDRLSARFAISQARVLLVGDWNAHLAHRAVGVVDDPELGDCGGP